MFKNSASDNSGEKSGCLRIPFDKSTFPKANFSALT